MKIKKKIIILFIISVTLIMLSLIEVSAAELNTNDMTHDNDYYYYDGYFYFYSYKGESTSTYSNGEGWFYDPKPLQIEGMYSHSKSDAEANNPLIGTASNYGFDCYDEMWDAGQSAPPKNPSSYIAWKYGVQKEKLVHAYYRRPKTTPSISSFNISGERYQNGNNYWIRSGDTVTFKTTTTQGFFGNMLQLDDYPYSNVLGLFGANQNSHSTQFQAKRSGTHDYKYDARDDEVNIGYSSNALGHYSCGAYCDYITTVTAQPIANNRDYTIGAYSHSWNGKDVSGWSNEGMLRTDDDAPTGSNVRVADSNNQGYWVYVDNVTDNRSGVNSVNVAVWTDYNGQDDLKWYPMSNCWGNTYRAYIPLSDHHNERGLYINDVYSSDNVENTGCLGRATITPIPDRDASIQLVDSNLNTVNSITMEAGTTWYGYVKALNTGSLTWTYREHYRLGWDGTTFPDHAWRSELSNDVANGQTYYFPVSLCTHSVGNYKLHYQMLQEGITWFGNEIDIPVYVVDTAKPTITAYVEHANQDGYDVIATATDSGSGINKVQCPTWTTAGPNSGQDDLVSNWEANPKVQAQNIGNNQYKFHVNIADHNNERDTYVTDVYAYDKVGNQQSVRLIVDIGKPTTDFDISPNPQLTGKTLNYTNNDNLNVPWLHAHWTNWLYSTDSISWSSASSSPPSSFSVTTPTIYHIKKQIGTYDSGFWINQYGTKVQYDSLWSDWQERTVLILPINTKPMCSFKVDSPIKVGSFLNYHDITKFSNDSWDSIVEEDWQWSADNINWNNGQLEQINKDIMNKYFPNNYKGTFYIRYRVKDKGNDLSPGLYSDWCTNSILAYYPVSVNASIVPYDDPNCSSAIPQLLKGQRAILKIHTMYYPTQLIIKFQSPLNGSDKTIQIEPKEELLTQYEFTIPLENVPDGTYTVNVTAVRGNETSVSQPQCSISSDIYKGIKTIIDY